MLPPVSAVTDLKSSDYDGIVVVAPSVSSLGESDLKAALQPVVDVDAKAEDGVFVAPSALPAKRVVFSGTGPLDKDWDDVRSFERAAEKGFGRALAAGCKRPLLYVQPHPRFPRATGVAVLGALKATFVPLETREQVPERAKKVDAVGVFGLDAKELELYNTLEFGRAVSRDIGGSDPERMAAPRVEEYVRDLFKGDKNVTVEVIQGQSTFEKEYPCLAAVNRAASVIPRHDGRVIWLTYTPPGPVEKTLMLVGKGITYDTGGADIKAGGIMAGMSRDKCGAADVCGIVKAVSMLQPKNVKVVAAMAMVRNSVGENCYVSDEIITARSGMRLRVGNTDAEGRMAMVDVLCHMKEKALGEVNPHLMTVATLTGHEVVAYGNYTAIMDNGQARTERSAQRVQDTGDAFGDMFEISTMRKEDYDFIRDKSGEFVDILQCNNLASSRSPRGHQFPGAFLEVVSGIDKHGTKALKPLKYSHVDVAGSSGGLPDVTTGSSVIALAMSFVN